MTGEQLWNIQCEQLRRLDPWHDHDFRPWSEVDDDLKHIFDLWAYEQDLKDRDEPDKLQGERTE